MQPALLYPLCVVRHRQVHLTTVRNTRVVDVATYKPELRAADAPDFSGKSRDVSLAGETSRRREFTVLCRRSLERDEWLQINAAITMEGFMTERPTLLGRADPLGHVYLPEDHSENHTARCGCVLDQAARDEHDAESCWRSAKSIVLSARTHIPVKL